MFRRAEFCIEYEPIGFFSGGLAASRRLPVRTIAGRSTKESSNEGSAATMSGFRGGGRGGGRGAPRGGRGGRGEQRKINRRVFVRPEHLVAMWLRSYPFLWASQCIWLSGLNIVPVFETYYILADAMVTRCRLWSRLLSSDALRCTTICWPSKTATGVDGGDRACTPTNNLYQPRSTRNLAKQASQYSFLPMNDSLVV